MITERPARKPVRLPAYDYAQNGAYFITFCTHDRRCLFWGAEKGKIDAVGARIARPRAPYCLTAMGEALRLRIEEIPQRYPSVFLDQYVIMPNHVHLLLRIDSSENNGRAMRAPTVSTVICQLKGAVSKDVGKRIWQKSFYDHVIRNERDYSEIWQYIEDNPRRWTEDSLYCENG